MMSALDLKYENIDVCPDNCMLFWKEHSIERKWLECGQSRFIEVVTQDGEKVLRLCKNLLSYYSVVIGMYTKYPYQFFFNSVFRLSMSILTCDS
jgi:hypothetical protein